MFSAERIKGSVHITAAGVPSFSNKIPSSKLLEQHDPQSPTPARTKSHFLASFWISSLVIGSDAVGCFDHTISLTSNRPFNFSATLLSTVSELGLLLSMIPRTPPLRDVFLDAVFKTSGAGLELGL